MTPKRAISLRPLVAEPDPEQVAEMVAAELDRQMKEQERKDWEAFVARLPKLARERLEKMATEPEKPAGISRKELAEAIRKAAAIEFGEPVAPLPPKQAEERFEKQWGKILDDQFVNGSGTETPKGVLSAKAQESKDAWKAFIDKLKFQAPSDTGALKSSLGPMVHQPGETVSIGGMSYTIALDPAHPKDDITVGYVPVKGTVVKNVVPDLGKTKFYINGVDLSEHVVPGSVQFDVQLEGKKLADSISKQVSKVLLLESKAEMEKAMGVKPWTWTGKFKRD